MSSIKRLFRLNSLLWPFVLLGLLVGGYAYWNAIDHQGPCAAYQACKEPPKPVRLTSADTGNSGVPTWVQNWITQLKKSKSRHTIERSTYKGKPAFLWIDGYMADTGDEHILYSETGQRICVFGGFAGHVTAGQCEINEIVWVEELYPSRK